MTREPTEPPCGVDCDDCAGQDERECGLVPIEIVAPVEVEFDWQGMARDLAHSLSEANRNLDDLIAALVDTVEALHQTHGFNVIVDKRPWQYCNDPVCVKTRELLASLIQSERDQTPNG